MKARDMAEMFRDDPTSECAKRLALALCTEVAKLLEVRRVGTTEGIVAVLRQQDDKWRAFCRLCPEVRTDGFKHTAHIILTDTQRIWP